MPEQQDNSAQAGPLDPGHQAPAVRSASTADDPFGDDFQPLATEDDFGPSEPDYGAEDSFLPGNGAYVHDEAALPYAGDDVGSTSERVVADGDPGDDAMRRAEEALAAAAEEEQERQRRRAVYEAMEVERAQLRQQMFERLNAQQREAVMAGKESVLVLAGAGSGKTSVLTARVARLVTDPEVGVGAHGVMAVTFTNKAAAEMRERLGKMLDRSSIHNMWIGTFHSLCNKMLRDNAQAAGLPKTFAILDTDGQESLCRSILKDLGLTKTTVKEQHAAREAAREAASRTAQAAAAAPGAAPAGPKPAAEADDLDELLGNLPTPSACVGFISRSKERLEPPRDGPAQVSAKHPMDVQLNAVYREYQERCQRMSLLDFQDLLTRAVDLLRKDAQVRDKMRVKFKAILVDEFQDTNDLQYEWLKLIKAPEAFVMAVGDDDQSIYAFRGAKPEYMSRFLKDLGRSRGGQDARLIKLEQNYRSQPHILEAANALIERNSDRLGKNLRTDQPDQGQRIDLMAYGNGMNEATSLATQIRYLVRDKAVQPSEIAILYRTNQQSRILESELNKLGLPVTVYGGFRFFERQEIKQALSYMELVNDLKNDLAFMRVANIPQRGLGERTLEELRQSAQSQQRSMVEEIVMQSERLQATPAVFGGKAAIKKQIALQHFVDTIMSMAEAGQTMDLHDLIGHVLDKSGLLKHYQDESASDPTAAERVENLKELVSAARQFIMDYPEHAESDTLSQLAEYLAHVALMTSTSQSDMNVKQTVSLMTVHSAKGLEFDHVFIAGLEEGCFPHQRSIDEDMNREKDGAGNDRGPSALEEERRLMYVAVTRARKRLVIATATSRMINGNFIDCTPSRFLYELPRQRLRVTLHPSMGGRKLPDMQADREPDGPAAPAGRATPAGRAGPAGYGGPGGPGRDSSAAQAPQPGRQRPPEQPALRIEPPPGGRKLAIVGTAGRSKEHQQWMNAAMWRAMLDDARQRVKPEDVLISGGAAWADHLAVALYLEGRCAGLVLHLPAPLRILPGVRPMLIGPGIEQGGSAASATGFYHDRFRKAAGVEGLQQIAQALAKGAQRTEQPPGKGYGALLARNVLIARDCDSMLAYTWGDQAPEDGGTLHSWEKAGAAQREHVSLRSLGPGQGYGETTGTPVTPGDARQDRPRMTA